MPQQQKGPVRQVVILFNKEIAVAETVDVGKHRSFTVQGLNAGGNPVKISDAAVQLSDPSKATATVGADGNGGDLLGVAEGVTMLTATAAGVTSTPVEIDVQDNTVVTVVVTFGA